MNNEELLTILKPGDKFNLNIEITFNINQTYAFFESELKQYLKDCTIRYLRKSKSDKSSS